MRELFVDGKGHIVGKSLDRQNVLRDTSLFSGSTYIAQVMFFIRGFLNAKILGPTLYGLWSALNIILKYSTFAHLGTFNSMSREIPYKNGQGSRESMDKVRDVTFVFFLSTIFIFSLILIIAAFLLRKTLSLSEFIGFIVIAFLAIAKALYEFQQTSLIAVKKFLLISRTNAIFPILSVIITLIFVPRLKIYGVYIVALCIPLLTVLYLFIKEPYRLRFIFDFKEIFRLMKIGFPIMSIDFLGGTIINTAGIITLFLLGKTSMGSYSVAMLVGRFLMYFPISIHRIFEPHIYQRYGETHDISELKKYLFKPTLVMALLFPIVIAFYYTGTTFFIRHFLSKYIVSIYPIFIILIAIFFVSFSPTAIAFITAMNKQKSLVPVYLAGIVIVGISSLVFINIGFGIMAAAIGLLLSLFFIGSIVFIYAISHYIKNTFKCLVYFATLCLPILYMTIIVILSEIIVSSSSGLFPDTLRLFIKLGILSIFSLPLIGIAHNKTGIMSDILGFLRIKT